jgi:DNA-binding NtrC family response regulator
MIKNKKIYSILVVEDNFNDSKKVEQLLLQMDFIPEITYAKNAQEVSSIFSADDNFFDVVLLDPTLPDISAQKLLSEMLDRVLFCPIILLVSNTEVDFSIQSIS